MIVAWNSLMISGLARASEVFSQPSCLELATAAANFIWSNQFVNGRFHRLNYQHQPSILAQSEDYAFFIKALLDLDRAGFGGQKDSPWLTKAIALQAEFQQFFWSEELAGYFNTASDASQDLIVRERSYTDNATPSANGVAIANLVRLALLTDNLEYLDLAEKGLTAFKGVMERVPVACPSLFTALDWFCNATLIRSHGEQIKSLLPEYLPTSVLTPISDLPDGTFGFVCQGLKCLAPATSLEQLLVQVKNSQVRGN
jgi:uncharacterized protein YyaL (SSP411 family)